MALIVQKYGGTSVGNEELIKKVAEKVKKRRDDGDDVVVVLSAMAGETDRLIDLAYAFNPNPNEREVDVLISTGEQVTVALLSIALNGMGCPARSFTGSQVKISTDNAYTKARIKEIDRTLIEEELKKGKVIVVTGFQGVDDDGNITTLGRGGSDTSAVALAAALEADLCEICTDVDGVYTTDPNICPKARKIDKISYDEMLEMASLGAKVLQTRSVEFAKKYKVPILVKSTFKEVPGTYVTMEDKDMEEVVVSGIAYNVDECKLTLRSVPDRPGIASKIFGAISEANIIVDMIIQNISAENNADITFTVPKNDLKKSKEILERLKKELNAKEIIADEDIAKVSIIGVGMRSHAGIASKMFQALASENINILMISTSEIKVSCAIERKYTELAVRVLHDVFGLAEGAKAIKEEL
ncbi:MAG: aspartate kinase [Deltaproteobacteria bacterium]|uniref:Aspartokinase n=1 Tax=Candidatus Zymogenus saltonus TaxID=2844893 RepID=A0A9D8KH76_9DELT|nr:aspartate kinase [Candidatus Zymogenus saltonus]